MARTISYRQAINEALAQEMERDERVLVMGEDVAGGEGAPVTTIFKLLRFIVYNGGPIQHCSSKYSAI